MNALKLLLAAALVISFSGASALANPKALMTECHKENICTDAKKVGAFMKCIKATTDMPEGKCKEMYTAWHDKSAKGHEHPDTSMTAPAPKADGEPAAAGADKQ